MVKTLRKFIRLLRDKVDHLVEGDGTQLRQLYPRYAIGVGSYGWPRVIDAGEGATLAIGAYCSIGKGVQIFLGSEHHTEWATTYPFFVFWPAGRALPAGAKTKGDVIIGNDVWIGQNAVILSGVTIGDGAVIGANALVAKNVEPYAIMGGNPARLIRKRFPDPIIARLLAIRWWTWPAEEIERALPLLLSSELERLLAYGEARPAP